MSKRQSTTRKSAPKLSDVSVTDSRDKLPTRRSTRKSHRLSTDSPNKSTIRATHQSPISAKESPKVSQYFPSRKRSQSSPRNQSSLELKYTRINSPNNKLCKRLLADNPITYGEFESSYEENSNQELIQTPRKPKVKPTVETKDCNKSRKGIDFKGFMDDFDSYMNEVKEEDMELTAPETNGIQNLNRSRDQNNSGVDSLTQRISNLDTKADTTKSNDYLNLVPSHSRDVTPNQKPVIRSQQNSITKPQELPKEELRVESNAKQIQSNSFEDDFDDSLDDILSQITIPIEDKLKSDEPSVQKADNIPNKVITKESIANNEIKDEEDDGFESDGDFERMLTQIPNEDLVTPSDMSDSALDTSIRNMSSSSLSSSGLITLSQIIELINRD